MLNFFRRSKIKVIETATAEVPVRRMGRPVIHGATVGGSQSPTYMTWANAKYQARLSTEFEDFNNFLKFMGEKPRGYQLARKDADQPHSPANSFWKKRTIY
jgi:hypothetical protein